MPSDPRFIQVPVPEHLVLDVYNLIAAQAPRGADGAPATDDDAQGWSEALIERCYRESPAAMKAIFDELARQAGSELTVQDFLEPVARAAGRDPGRRAVAGTLGAFGRRVRNRYGKTTWPMGADWNSDRREVIYRMDERTAEIIRRLA